MESNFSENFSNVSLLIILLLLIIIIVTYCLLLIKHFSKKNLQEKSFYSIFASEKERDRILALMERDRQETEELEKQAKDFGLK